MDPLIGKDPEPTGALPADEPKWDFSLKPVYELPPGEVVDYEALLRALDPPEPVWDYSLEPVYELPPGVEIDYDEYITDDGAAVDSPYVEKQYRLLTAPLIANWPGPRDGRPFIVVSDVGLYAIPKEPAIVPDVMLSVGVRFGDFRQRKNLSYFGWVMGKPPDVAIEIVSGRRGGEEDRKVVRYAQIKVPYYVIFDPDNKLKGGVLRSFELIDGTYKPLAKHFYPNVELGLKLWQGPFEGEDELWLRWCDEAGVLVETGEESNAIERQFREKEQQRADDERKRADDERKRADNERQLREKLEAQLRALGIDPAK